MCLGVNVVCRMIFDSKSGAMPLIRSITRCPISTLSGAVPLGVGLDREPQRERRGGHLARRREVGVVDARELQRDRGVRRDDARRGQSSHCCWSSSGVANRPMLPWLAGSLSISYGAAKVGIPSSAKCIWT